MAVVVVFFHKLKSLSPNKPAAERKTPQVLWSKVIVATMPTNCSFPLSEIMDQYFDKPWVYAITLPLQFSLLGWSPASVKLKQSVSIA